jgi:hypothetical protein
MAVQCFNSWGSQFQIEGGVNPSERCPFQFPFPGNHFGFEAGLEMGCERWITAAVISPDSNGSPVNSGPIPFAIMSTKSSPQVDEIASEASVISFDQRRVSHIDIKTMMGVTAF